MCKVPVNEVLGETLRSYERGITLLAGNLEALRCIRINSVDSRDNVLMPLVYLIEALIAVLKEVLERFSSVRT